MSDRAGPLAGIVVVERAGRLATAGCGALLAALGARVLRLEHPGTDAALDRMPFAEQLLRAGAKERVLLDPSSRDYAASWRRHFQAADAFLFDPPEAGAPDAALVAEVLAAEPGDKVLCALSPCGLAGGALPNDAGDVLMQAVSGVMAVSGRAGGPPDYVRVPVGELSAAVLATTAVQGALRVARRDGVGQLIDLSIVEVMVDQLRTHIPLVASGQTRGFRLGCRHPACVPWNVYRARDGWVMVCSASDAQWRNILTAIDRTALVGDPRYATLNARIERAAEVDAILGAWMIERGIDAAVRALEAGNAPVGPALDVDQVLTDPGLRAGGTVRAIDTGGVTRHAPGCAIRLDRTPAHPAIAPAAVRTEAAAGLAPRAARPGVPDPKRPLAGIRVVELSRYAAGPLGGLVLASLGAEVIKIEATEGEDCRGWTPRFGQVSGYYANYNAGKRSIAVDLRDKAQRERLVRLVSGADVLLQNMRPGSLERLGLGAAAVRATNPRLVYATISGFGPQGAQLAALDTVIQGRVGLSALVGDGTEPMRIGYSIADQISGHFAAAGVVAALIERDRSGIGQVLDVAMVDGIAWLTQMAWDRGTFTPPAVTCVSTADGMVVAEAPQDVVDRALAAEPASANSPRSAVAATLARSGVRAVAVLEVDEVLAQPLVAARRSLLQVDGGGGTPAPVFAVPLGLTRTPTVRPSRMAMLGEDNALLNG